MRYAMLVVLLFIAACGSADESVYLEIEENPVPSSIPTIQKKAN